MEVPNAPVFDEPLAKPNCQGEFRRQFAIIRRDARARSLVSCVCEADRYEQYILLPKNTLHE